MNLDKYENMPAEVGLPAFVRICQAHSIAFSIGFDNGNRKTSQGTKLLDVWGWMIRVGKETYQYGNAEMTYPTLWHAIRAGFRLLNIYINQADTLILYRQADPYEAVAIEHELQAFLNLCEWNEVAAVLAVHFEQDDSWRVKVGSKVTPFDDSDPIYPSLKQVVRTGIYQLIDFTDQRGFQLRAKPPDIHPILNYSSGGVI